MHRKDKHEAESQKDNAPPADAAAPEGAAIPPPAPAAPEADAARDRLLRLQADFDNFRKRAARERAEISNVAREDLLLELLPVLDHFELGLKTATERATDKAVQPGFQMVYDQLMGMAKKFGLTPIDVHEGHFDPHLHEAVTHVPSDEYQPDEIVAQTRRGYKLGEKLLRPVQVVVSSGPGAPRDDEVKPGSPGEVPERGSA